MSRAAGVILPCTMVGSYPRPAWFTYQLMGRDIWEAFKLQPHLEAYTDATRTVIKDQELAGLDILTDGQMWFDEYGGTIGSFVWYWYERLPGFSPVKHRHPALIAGTLSPNDAAVFTDWGSTATTGKIEPRDLHLDDLFRLAQAQTTRPIKACVGAGPMNLALHVHYGVGYQDRKELAYDLVPIFNREMKKLVAAGCRFIQLEDLGAWIPQMTGNRADFDWVVDVVNRTIEGVDAFIGWHFCYGNAYGNMNVDFFKSGYASVFPELYAARVHQYVLDFACREMADAAFLKDLPSDKEVAVGVIDVRTTQIETAEHVARRIRTVLEMVPPERVTLTTDCGLRALPRFCAYNKLRAMVEGARIVRRELGLPEDGRVATAPAS